MENTSKTQTTFDDVLAAELPAWSKSVRQRELAQARRERTQAQKRVNDALYEMGRIYHVSVPLATVSELLTKNGFEPLEDMILCGREGRINESVGRDRW